MSLSEGYDDDVRADLRSGSTPGRDAESGVYTSLTGGLDYGQRVGRVALNASTSSALRSHGGSRGVTDVSHGASVRASVPVIGRATLHGSQSLAYSPSYLYGLFPVLSSEGAGTGAVVAPDYSTYRRRSFGYTSTVGVARPVRGAGRMAVDADYQQTDFSASAAAPRNTRSLGVRAGYTHTVSRRSALSVSYGYRAGEFGYSLTGGRTSEQTFGAGIEYSRPLSTARAANVQVRVGGSFVDAPAAAFAEAALAARSHYRLSSDMSLGYQFRRGWQVRGNFRRSVEYIPDLVDPVLMDATGVGVDGLITRRLSVDVSAAYAEGQSALSRTGSAFDTYTGSAQVQYALGRSLAVYAQYYYYYYDFSRSAGLAVGVPAQFERQGARVGMTTRLSLLRR